MEVERCGDIVEGRGAGFEDDGNPETTGGGKSNPSVAFFCSSRAKSELWYHSKNLSANIEVGRRSLRLLSAVAVVVLKVEGWKMLLDCPGR